MKGSMGRAILSYPWKKGARSRGTAPSRLTEPLLQSKTKLLFGLGAVRRGRLRGCIHAQNGCGDEDRHFHDVNLNVKTLFRD